MPSEFDDLLIPAEEYVRPRAPKELREWVLAKCRTFRDLQESKREVLLHEGRFKQFHEELFPLSIFAVRCYGDRSDVICVPSLDDRVDFDARIDEPSRTIRMEITVAGEGYEDHLRMLYFLEHGAVSLSSPVEVHGTKKAGRRINVRAQAHERRELLVRHLDRVRAAAIRKAGGGRYGKGYELIIAVEDWWFDGEIESDAARFIEGEVLTLPLNFDAVHIVGYNERLFLTFNVGPGHKGGRPDA